MRYTWDNLQEEFPDNDACLQFIFDKQLGKTKTCPKCGVVHATFYRVKSRPSYVCKDCKYQHFPLKGTIFEKTTTPLRHWFHAIFEFSKAKNGISAKELESKIGVSYKTAHRLAKQIRLLMKEYERLGLKGTPVEVDELFISYGKKSEGVRDNSTPIIAALEVGGQVRTKTIPRASSKHAIPFLNQYVLPGSKLHTDESKVYKHSQIDNLYFHDSVRHIGGEYVNKRGATTNHVESFFGQFRSSLRGTFHSVSPRYLEFYVAEFAFRRSHLNEPIFSLLLTRAAKRVQAG